MRLLFFSKMTWPKKAIRNMLLVLYDMMSEKVISIWVNKKCKVQKGRILLDKPVLRRGHEINAMASVFIANFPYLCYN